MSSCRANGLLGFGLAIFSKKGTSDTRLIKRIVNRCSQKWKLNYGRMMKDVYWVNCCSFHKLEFEKTRFPALAWKNLSHCHPKESFRTSQGSSAFGGAKLEILSANV